MINALQAAKAWAEDGLLDEDRLRTLCGLVEDVDAFLAQLDELGLKVKKAPHRAAKRGEDVEEE